MDQPVNPAICRTSVTTSQYCISIQYSGRRRWSIWSGFTEQDRQTLEWLRRHVGDAAIAAAVERCAGSGKPYLSSVCRQLGVKTPGFHLPRRESPSPVAEQSLAAIRGILAARTASTDVDGRESGRFTLVAQPADVAATAALKEALPSMNANPAASHGT